MRTIKRSMAVIAAMAIAITAFSGIVSAQETTVEVTLRDLAIDMPSTIPAGPVTLEVTNTGNMPHTIIIEGEGVRLTMPETLLPAGPRSTTWEIDLAPGTYVVWCPIGAHRAEGMEVTITVEGVAQQPNPTATPAEAGPTPTAIDYDNEYAPPSASDATPTALPGMPDTGVGGTQSDGASTGLLVALGVLILAIAAIGGGLYYRRSGPAGPAS